MIFVRAGAFKNEFNTRTFAEGDKLSLTVRSRIRTAAEFQVFGEGAQRGCDLRARHPGALGYITARTAKVPPEILHEVAKALATNPSRRRRNRWSARCASPPVACSCGSARVARRRRGKAMVAHVKSELRRQFVEDVPPEGRRVRAGPLALTVT
jgi:hypothetical protein